MFLDFRICSLHNISRMPLTAEPISDKSLTLIVSSPGNPLAHAIIRYHSDHDTHIVSTTHIPPRVSHDIKTCFCLTGLKYLAEDAESLKNVPLTILVASYSGHLTHREAETIRLILRHYPHTKIALIPAGEHDLTAIVERLIYFSFDEGTRQTVITTSAIVKEPETVRARRTRKLRRLPTLTDLYIGMVSRPLRFVIAIIMVIIVAHTLFLIPLGLSVAMTAWQGSVVIGQMGREVSSEEVATDPFSTASALLMLSERLYDPIRRGWLFVGGAWVPERLFEVTGEVMRLYHLAQDTRERTDVVLAKMLDPQAVSQEQIADQLVAIRANLAHARDGIRTIQSQVPTPLLTYRRLDAKLQAASDLVSLGLRMLDQADTILGRDNERLYAVFFANDREIRPGGGFIGSFMLVSVKNMQIKEWKLYDVYDADGQLKARVAPPEPISRYLQQPFYFLRDSAFSPDHPTNAILAEDFLSKELGIDRLDGAVMVTFASIERLLADIGPVYLTEYQDTITSENVYIKTQLYAEKDSFPGSIQKKDFLQALMTHLLVKIAEPRTAFAALQSLQDSLDHKRIAIYVDDPGAQTMLDEQYWSGRQLSPGCIDRNVPGATVCVPLYVYPVEANLGVNKANAFVVRDYEYKVQILEPSHEVEAELVTHFSNDSYPDVFPGGTYRNYYQIYLPPDIKIQSIRIGDAIATDPDISRDKYTRVGLWISVPPQGSLDVSVKYRPLQTLPSSDSQLQIIFQKQLGLPASSIAFKFAFAPGYMVSDTNFSPLAQGRVVEYNSTIDSDKFYYIHFSAP